MMDLLSDEDDSFFEDPKVKKKPTLQNKTPKSTAVENLFGLSDEKQATPEALIKPLSSALNKEVDWLGLGEDLLSKDEQSKVTSKSNFASVSKPVGKIGKKISFEDDDDLLGGLGLDSSKKHLDEKGDVSSKKSSILKDLLGEAKQQKEEKKITTFEDVLQSSQARKELDTTKTSLISGENIEAVTGQNKEFSSMSSQKVQNVSSVYAPSSAAREGRRSRPTASSSIIDPLGILGVGSEKTSDKSSVSEQGKETSLMFPASTSRPNSLERSAQQKNKPMLSQKSISLDFESDNASKSEQMGPAKIKKLKDIKAASSPNFALPDWLGSGSSFKSPKTDQLASSSTRDQQQTNHEDKQLKEETTAQTVANVAAAHFINSNFYKNSVQDTILNQQKLSLSNLELQNAQVVMQQQESQVLMALQLKKYEDSLADVQRSQQELIIKQEQQFNSLLERQFAKQQIMENNMRLQQERINNHIQLLLTQPHAVEREKISESENQFGEFKKETLQMNEDEYKKLIDNLKQKHHEEMFLMDESYKRQIILMEQNMETVEHRLKQEIINLKDHYDEKLQTIKMENESEISIYKQKIEEMKELHTNELKSIRDNHTRACEEIRYEYSVMVENIKESRKTEKLMTENADDYVHGLKQSLVLLDSNNKALHHIKSELEIQQETHVNAKKESLDIKEEELKAMKVSLEKVQDQMQLERAQLLGVIRGLETKLVEQTQASREEQWALQQATAVLTARAAALDREIEFSRNSAEREREQIKILKETLLVEQEKNILQLTEEKLALATEKAKLETSSKLSNSSYDAAKARAEIDAAIQVAKEAAEMTDREREHLQKQQCEMEMLKRQLKDREFKLTVKERDLEETEKKYLLRLQEGQKMLDDAKNMELKCNEKMRDIQRQLQALAMREKKMNEEKIYLSKERLALQQVAMKTDKKCGLCNVENNSPETVKFPENVAELETPRYSITNPELLRFRLSLGLNDENEDILFNDNDVL